MSSEKRDPAFLARYVSRQVEHFFPDGFEIVPVIQAHLKPALERTEQCISAVKAWSGKGFDYLVSGQNATFLYFLAHRIYRETGDTEAATRIFLLNKALNGIDLFYEVEMPDYFLVGHTVGMVFAKATYADYCIFHQGCTVGKSETGRPVLERGVVLFPGSMVIGDCLVRENTVLAPGVVLVNEETPGDCVCLPGPDRKPVFQRICKYYAEDYYSGIEY
ncbi:hypothetical protein KP001_03045 [Geomonas subterranea]|uniref:Serine O-acetyltransferase n=1 Tax=Geomonas subterranea TaxID=2847989 RepID=A0ABX8LMS7_9BACT|nr:hypothetical protein [Geomonas subterranea]QXE91538.1 hypothetical protein KP001_03045 [Geomonas subterranea]QXM10373.1 hypothetical protein KP002_04450 [Geomonas subterranea]